MKLNRNWYSFILLLVFVLMVQYAFAEILPPTSTGSIIPPTPTISEAPSTASDIIATLVELVKNWKGLGVMGIISGFVVLLVEFAKATFLSSLWAKWGTLTQHAVVVTLAWISQILIGVTHGMPWLDSIIAGLVTGGGAIAIYEAVAGAIKGPPPATGLK